MRSLTSIKVSWSCKWFG